MSRRGVPGAARPYVYFDAEDNVWRIEWRTRHIYAEAPDWPTAIRRALRVASRQGRQS